MKNYPKCMLPGIDYKPLMDSGLRDMLVDLEYETMRDLDFLTEEMTEILKREGFIQAHELILAQLCGYLGFLTVTALGKEEIERFLPLIESFLKQQAYQSYKLFSKYPISTNLSQEVREQHLNQLCSKGPGSLVVQTVRLGRVIYDALETLFINSPYSAGSREKQEMLVCPPVEALALFKERVDIVKKRCKYDYPILYVINQTAIQLAWVMGYFSHLSKRDTPLQYLTYGTPCIRIYAEFFTEIKKRKLKIPRIVRQ